MGKLEIPQSIDAKALIKKATMFGHCFIDDETQSEIFGAEKDIKKAQGDVKKADGDVTSAENEKRKAETQSSEAQSKQKSGESESQSAPTKESVGEQGAQAESIMTATKSRSQAMTDAGNSAKQQNSVFSNMLDGEMGKIDGFSVEITSLSSENQALMAENQALNEQIRQESSFDGTGSGKSSAYSLSTGAEIAEQEAAQAAQGSTATSGSSQAQAKIDSNNAKIEANGAKTQELTQQAQAEQQTVEGEKSTAQSQLQQQQASAEAAKAENDNSNGKLQKIGEYAELASNIGGTIDAVGDAVKVAGVAVSTAGGVLTATGTAVGITGGTLTATGGAITLIGAPLCALFGIGVPIVGAGGATTGSGIGVAATGGTVGGTGASLLSTGATVKKVGDGISVAGNVLKAAGDGTTAYVRAAQGDVAGAVQATMGAISSISSSVSSIGGSSEKIASAVNKVVNGAAAVTSGISAYQAAKSGDKAAATANGISALSYAAAGVFGGKTADIAQRFANGSMVIGSGLATYKSIEEGDTKGAVLNGISTLGFAYATGGKHYTSAVSNLSTGLSETAHAMKDFDEGDNTNGGLNVAKAVLHTISGVGSAGVEYSQRRAAKAQTSAPEESKKVSSNTAKANDDTDPINDVPENWSSMTAEERRANLQERQARHQEWVKSHPDAGLSEAERVGRTNPEHSRYEYEISSEQLGRGKTVNVDGIELEADAPQSLRTDVSHTQRQTIQSDVAKLRTPGMSQEFVDGLETLEAFQTSRVAYNSNADGSYDLRATKADNARPYGTFASNPRVKAMGLDGDLGIVQDAATLSGLAYSDADSVKKSGWTQVASSSADNGFHAKAFEKDGKIMIAFRGSDDAADLTSDYQMVAGRVPEQLENANNFVAQVRQQHPDAQIIVTGHSLGGALTELVASKNEDVLGLTFDAVGTRDIVKKNGLKDNNNTINYVVNGDVISNANEHVGTVTVVNETVTRGTTPNSPHAITNFMGKDNNSLLCVEAGMVERQLSSAEKSRAALAQRGLTIEALAAGASNGKIVIADTDFKAVKTQFEYDIKNANADLSVYQRQVDMVSNPEQRAQLQRVLDSRRTSVTAGADISRNSHVVQNLTSTQINEDLKQNYGISEAAFGDTPGAKISFDRSTKMVRVFNDASSFGKGNWLMAYDDVAGLTPAQIKEKFALPAAPKYVVEIEVPAGCEMVTGSCKPVEGWGKGGGTQYFITGGNRPKFYGQIRRLPQ